MTLKKLLEESKNGVVLFTCRYRNYRNYFLYFAANLGLEAYLALDP